MFEVVVLDKMDTLFVNPVNYFFRINQEKHLLNQYIGKEISLRFTGRIFCTLCGSKTKKSFGEGMCYKCFTNSPENAECIIRPELCLAHEHKGRDVEWEISHHLQPHFVYMALVSEPKVGVTRSTQIPTRWIDQGANKAILIAETPYRQLAGAIEVFLKNYYTDKTHWMKMLRNDFNHAVDLTEEKEKCSRLLPSEWQEFISTNNEVVELIYPVTEYPEKVSSFSFDKTSQIKSPLIGIRGQYLLFENGVVLNVRKHSGYEIEFSIS